MVGTDSTATAVRCIFYYIITNARIYTTLQLELDQALRKKALSRPVLRDSESRILTYLQACIKEGLRIWPPVASLIYKTAPPEGDTLEDGRFIPGGTNVGYSAWGVHHSKSTYGADTEIYRPERWLEAKGEELQAMERSLELVFGTGKYGCLGKTIAFFELNKVFAEVGLLSLIEYDCLDLQGVFKGVRLTRLPFSCSSASSSVWSIHRKGLRVDAMGCSCSQR
jgi:cytochrome P450